MTGSPASDPPRLAERLLAACYRDRDWAEAILGDLREEYAIVARRLGPAAARRWHWGQTLRLAGRRLTGGAPARPVRRSAGPGEPREQGRRWTGLQRDVAYAARALVRRPALTLTMIGALALGLAANATIFTVADALVLRPFRFPTVDRLVYVGSVGGPELFDRVSPGDFLDWHEQATTIDGLAALQMWEPNFVGRDEPEQLPGFRVSGAYFDTMGLQAATGRLLAPDDETPGHAHRVVIGHALWQRRFAGSPAAVGGAMRLDGELYEIVGVAPEGFRVPYGAEVWSPLVLGEAARADRRTKQLMVIGRLATGVRLDAAGAELRTLAARQRERYPATNAKREAVVKTFTAGMGDPAIGGFMIVWQAAALLLLLVASANVLNLLLARGIERQQEFAVRLALGAGRGRIVRQLAIEGALLAAAGIALAVPLAWLGLALARGALPPALLRFVPGWDYLHLEPRGLAVTATLAALATVAFSLAPAAHAVRGVGDALRSGGRTATPSRRHAWGRALVAGTQIALTLTLLTGAALAIGATYHATRGPLGFDSANVLVARLVLPMRPYAEDWRRTQFIDTVLDRLAAVPAVRTAAAISALPYGSQTLQRPLYPEGRTLRPEDVQSVDLRRATPGYFDVLRIPLLQGRALRSSDGPASEAVALVSRSLADRYWPGADPLNRRVRLAEDGPWITVVGVVGDVVHDWYLSQRNPTIYRPAAQEPPYIVNLVARTAGDPLATATDLRRAIAAADPAQPVRELLTMSQVVDQRAAGLRFAADTLGVMGAVSLVLALVGIYSLMSYSISRRTREMGVRMAFGATPADVARLSLRQAAVIAGVGTAAGLAPAIAIGRGMQALMSGAVAASPLVPLALAVALGAAALAASYAPARRAARQDPTVALRSE